MDFLRPQLDVVFKMLFTRNEHLLGSMLEAVLEVEVQDVTILNPEIPGDLSEDKLIWLDILVLLGNGTRVNVEMQSQVRAELVPRVVFYAARNYTEHVGRGEPYTALMPSVTVLWLAQPLFADLEQYHSVFELRERKTGRLFTERLTLHVMQLTEIAREQAPTGRARGAQLWGQFLSAESELEFRRLAAQDDVMAQAVDALEALSQDPAAARLARQRQEAEMFAKMRDELTLRKGREEGREEGREQGREQGREEALRQKIIQLCERLGLELNEERQAKLKASAAELSTLLDAIAIEHRWPE